MTAKTHLHFVAFATNASEFEQGRCFSMVLTYKPLLSLVCYCLCKWELCKDVWV